MEEPNMKTSGDNISSTNSIFLQRGREYQSFQDEEVTTTCIVNKDDKLFSGPFYVSTISDKRSSCGSSCIKRDSPSIMLRQVNDSEIDLRKHDQPKNTDNESTKFVNIISGSVIGIKRSLTTVENNLECIKEVNQKPKRGYKHVPHREKSVQVVEKRNARERKRVQEVNQAFLRLQKALPTLNKQNKRLSKVRILKNTTAYILNLRRQLSEENTTTHLNKNISNHLNR